MLYIEHLPILEDDVSSYAEWNVSYSDAALAVEERAKAFKDMRKWVNTFKIDKNPLFNMSFGEHDVVAASKKAVLDVIDEQIELLTWKQKILQVVVLEDKRDYCLLKKKKIPYSREWLASVDVHIPAIDIKFSFFFFLLSDEDVLLVLPAVLKGKTFVTVSHPLRMSSIKTTKDDVLDRFESMAKTLEHRANDLRWVTAGSLSLAAICRDWDAFTPLKKEHVNKQLLLLLKFRLCDSKVSKEKNFALKQFSRGNYGFMEEYVQKNYKE